MVWGVDDICCWAQPLGIVLATLLFVFCVSSFKIPLPSHPLVIGLMLMQDLLALVHSCSRKVTILGLVDNV